VEIQALTATDGTTSTSRKRASYAGVSPFR
jgi:hypothetical protein